MSRRRVNNGWGRQRLLDAVIDVIPLDGEGLAPDLWSQPLPLDRDVPHLLERLAVETNEPRRRFIARAIYAAWSQSQDLKILGAIAQACLGSANGTDASLVELEEVFAPTLRPPGSEGEDAQALVARYRLRREAALHNDQLMREANTRKNELNRQQRQPNPPLDELIETCLVDMERGDLSAWKTLNHLLLFETDGTSPLSSAHGELTKYPGWERASPPIRARLVDGARAYVQGYEPQTLEQIQKDGLNKSSTAGYRALGLLLDHNQAEVEALSSELWTRWSAPIVLFPYPWDRRHQLSAYLPLALAYRRAPQAVLKAFRVRLEQDLLDNNPTASLWMLEGALDDADDALENHPQLETIRPVIEGFWQPGDAFCEFLIEHMKRPEWEPEVFGVWLRLLLKRHAAEADIYARHLVTTSPPPEAPREEEGPGEDGVPGKLLPKNPQRERGIVAAATLLSEADDGGWPVVWPKFQADRAFGCVVVEHLAPHAYPARGEDLPGLSERELADFYLWLEQEYPYNQDPNVVGWHRTGTREFVGRYRDDVLGQLARRKTLTACHEIERLIEQLPKVTPLRDTLRYAREMMSREQWQPMDPASVLALAPEPMEEPEPHIAIVTALPEEHEAMKALLDDPQPLTLPGEGSGRVFTVGTIPARNGQRRIVVGRLVGMNNTLSAAGVTQMLERFPSVKSVVMCGVAGGVPHPTKPGDHVRLGDAVVCDGRGVVQYDYGKEALEDGQVVREVRSSPAKPGAGLTEAANRLMDNEAGGRRPWLVHIERAIAQLSASGSTLNWERPDGAKDVLLDSRILNRKQKVKHPDDSRREVGRPRLFCGPIASSNFVQSNPQRRDELRDEFKVKAIEMEASGVADASWVSGNSHFTVVRGVCDYCDSRSKGDDWHSYAAVVAAAFTRSLLETLPVTTGSDA